VTWLWSFRPTEKDFLIPFSPGEASLKRATPSAANRKAFVRNGAGTIAKGWNWSRAGKGVKSSVEEKLEVEPHNGAGTNI
jgi:hypothetical protein